MKKQSVLPTAACLLIILSLLSACTKYQDHLPPGTVPCKISHIIFLDQFPPAVDSFTFTYNANGDPVLAMRAITSDGSPSVQFMYDSHNRLTGINYVAENGGTLHWFKYHYATANSQNPLIDSDFLFPTNIDTDPPREYDNLVSTSFQFDRQNRIAQSTTLDVSVIQHGGNFDGVPDTFVSNYKYTPAGNLLGSTYDNKVNFLSTSRILQFLQADYSVNNNTTHFNNFQYNEFGLPTQFDINNYLLFMYAQINGTIRIEYDCACLSGQKAR
jgi:hypothetical protein